MTPTIDTPNALVNRRLYCVRQDNRGMIYDGKKIAALRDAKGWSQAELARRARIKQPSLWSLEHQMTKEPKASTLHALAQALGVPLRDILVKNPPKGAVPSAEDVLAIYEALSDVNKIALAAAAEALLKNSPKP